MSNEFNDYFQYVFFCILEFSIPTSSTITKDIEEEAEGSTHQQDDERNTNVKENIRLDLHASTSIANPLEERSNNIITENGNENENENEMILKDNKFNNSISHDNNKMSCKSIPPHEIPRIQSTPVTSTNEYHIMDDTTVCGGTPTVSVPETLPESSVPIPVSEPIPTQSDECRESMAPVLDMIGVPMVLIQHRLERLVLTELLKDNAGDVNT